VKAPRLIGLLIDLPAAATTELAARWGCAATPTALYEVMTSPRLAALVGGLPDATQQVVRALAPAPLRADDLLGRLALGPESAERSLLDLGGLGLVARVGSSGRAQPLVGAVGRDWLAVPREVAAALTRAAAAG
jgi:hypothetical protein